MNPWTNVRYLSNSKDKERLWDLFKDDNHKVTTF